MAQVLILIIISITALNAQFKVKSLKELKYKDVTQQTYEESCGASSMSTLFNLYGVKTDEKTLLKDLKTTDMVNFLDLQKIALKNDFRAKGYKIDKEVFEQLTVPVIARVIRKENYPHFVVVKNLKGDFVLILDPNNGKFLMNKKEFYDSWIGQNSNYILVAVPNKDLKLKDIGFLDISQIDYIKDK